MFLARFQVVSSLLIALFSFSCAPNHGDSSQTAQTLNVLNGRYASEDKLIGRSTVVIYGGNTGDCSGSVLSSNIILTAGHCVSDVDNHGRRFLLPTAQLSVKNFFEGSPVIGIDKILIPKEYYAITDFEKYEFGRDIALLRLSQKLPPQYVPVVIERDLNQVSQQALYFAGYGDWALEMSDNASNTTNYLAIGQIRLKDTIQMASDPSLAYWMKFKVGRNDPSPCHGDSGGPIYYEKDGRIHQVALTVGVSFASKFEERRYRCGLPTSSEVASTVFGPNFDFINNGYRELTGASLLVQ